MVGRAGAWALGGAVAATAGLLASPATYERLRRLGRRALPQTAATLELPPPEPELVDTTDARRSLQARLAESRELGGAPPEGVATVRRMRRPERADAEPRRQRALHRHLQHP